MLSVPPSDSPQTPPAVPRTPRSWNFPGHSVLAPLGYPSGAASSTGASSSCVYYIKKNKKNVFYSASKLRGVCVCRFINGSYINFLKSSKSHFLVHSAFPMKNALKDMAIHLPSKILKTPTRAAHST